MEQDTETGIPGDRNSSPISMRRLQNTNLSPPSISGAYELDRSISKSQGLINTTHAEYLDPPTTPSPTEKEKYSSTGSLFHKFSTQQSIDNGSNSDIISKPGIHPAHLQPPTSGCYKECTDVCTCDNKNGISTPRPDSGFAGDESEDEIAKCFRRANEKLQELIDTENSYGESLDTVVEIYIPVMEEGKHNPLGKGCPPMPADLSGGRDKIVLGNIRDIYSYQKKMVKPDIQDCLENPWKLKHIFACKKDRLKQLYGKYAINKQKSELIVQKFSEYFTLVRFSKNIKLNISSLLMSPVQRVTRYPLLLNDINKLCQRAKNAAETEGKQLTEEQKKKTFWIQEALDLSFDLANYVNNMMEAGKIMQYPGSITENGLLKEKSDVICYKRISSLSIFGKKQKTKKCQIFVFDKGVVLAEKIESNILGSEGQNFTLNHWTTFPINIVTTRELAKCLDSSAFGFELERQATGIKDGGTTSNQIDPHPLLDDIDPKEKKEVVKSVIVQSDTMEERDKILSTINQIKKSIIQQSDIFTNPGNYATIYRKKCLCRTVPPHILEN